MASGAKRRGLIVAAVYLAAATVVQVTYPPSFVWVWAPAGVAIGMGVLAGLVSLLNWVMEGEWWPQ